MKRIIRIILGTLIILFGYAAVKKEFGVVDLGLFSELNIIPFILLIVLTITALFFDITSYRQNKIVYAFTTSFVGLFLCCVILFKMTQRNIIDSSKTVLEVSSQREATHFFTFDFKDNGNFKLTEIDMLGQTVFYGKYKKSNDNILLLENNYNGEIKNFPTKAIIRQDTVYWNSFDTMLVVKNN